MTSTTREASFRCHCKDFFSNDGLGANSLLDPEMDVNVWEYF